MLNGMLVKNFQQRLGSQLNEKQTSRLERGLEHYMSEVFQANASLPVQSLNKEVLAATASDFTDYLQRQDAVAQAPANTFQETSQRYDQIQADRQRSMEAPRPSIPDYVQPLVIKEDDSISALSLFEEAKKRRNMETSVQAEEQLAKRSASAQQPLYLEPAQERPNPRSMFDKPLDMVLAGTEQRELPGRGDGNYTLARPGPNIASRGTLQQDMLIKQEDIQSYKETEYNLSVYSADRNWELDVNNSESRFNFSVNLNSTSSAVGVNMQPKAANRFKNIVRIEFVKAIVPIEATDMIVRKVGSINNPDITQAIVNAHAVAITSVNANTSAVAVPASSLAANNLQMYRDVKALITPGDIKYDSTYLKSVYSYPFITLNISELDTNTYGTSSSMDNAFGILQYDSNWTDNTDSLGFTSLIPKHMKCQRIYAPTPLSTLNKLSIRLQQPNGHLINTMSDTLDIAGIFLSSDDSIRPYFNGKMDLSGTVYSDVNSGEYVWIDCKKWFSRYQFAVGDRIQIKNLSSRNPTPAITDFINFMQSENGLIIAGIAYDKLLPNDIATKYPASIDEIDNSNPSSQVGRLVITNGQLGSGQLATSVLVDGPNSAGYARYLIVRGKFADPTTGSTDVSPYGGANSNFDISTDMISGNTKIIPGKLINVSRQTQLIFRVITREYDSTSLVRPDNL